VSYKSGGPTASLTLRVDISGPSTIMNLGRVGSLVAAISPSLLDSLGRFAGAVGAPDAFRSEDENG